MGPRSGSFPGEAGEGIRVAALRVPGARGPGRGRRRLRPGAAALGALPEAGARASSSGRPAARCPRATSAGVARWGRAAAR
eukprot:6989853-Alexandrium_andersonii.AAC.1